MGEIDSQALKQKIAAVNEKILDPTFNPQMVKALEHAGMLTPEQKIEWILAVINEKREELRQVDGALQQFFPSWDTKRLVIQKKWSLEHEINRLEKQLPITLEVEELGKDIGRIRGEIRGLSANLTKPGTEKAKVIIRKRIQRLEVRLEKLDGRIETLQCKQAEQELGRKLNPK